MVLKIRCLKEVTRIDSTKGTCLLTFRQAECHGLFEWVAFSALQRTVCKGTREVRLEVRGVVAGLKALPDSGQEKRQGGGGRGVLRQLQYPCFNSATMWL